MDRFIVPASPAPTRNAPTWFETMTLPALPAIGRRTKLHEQRWPHWYDDRWLLALVICAICASGTAAVWAYQTHAILLYADAHGHLLIARRVVDNIYPGLAQLGNVWLPLPHLLMAPFAQNDFLWRTGLAGTFTSMPCYLIASIYVFLTARRLTHDSRASFFGSLLFVLNPNILYLQTTPLSEPVLFATLAAASYYFVAWAQTDDLRELVTAALATLLATLSRYDGWALLIALMGAILIVGWRKRQPWAKTFANVVVFTTLGGVGIVLWFVWNLIIFGSPTAFLSGSYSSQNQTESFIQRGVADTYHNAWLSIRTYLLATAESVGPIMLALAAVALIMFLARRRLSSEALAALTILTPVPFYALAFYSGQNVMYVPHANFPPSLTFFNARFGAEMAAPTAVFIGVLFASARRWRVWAQIALLLLVLAQTAFIATGGVISLQDGQVGSSCYPAHPIVAFLAEHYDGGLILVNVYSTNIDLSPAGIPFHNEIYEGDGVVWANALNEPEKYVEWIITAPKDLISQRIDTRSQEFLQNYSLVAQDSPTTATLWRLKGLDPLPSRPLPDDLVAPYVGCNDAKGIPLTNATDPSSGLSSVTQNAPGVASPAQRKTALNWALGKQENML
jgi:hypothetical protein